MTDLTGLLALLSAGGDVGIWVLIAVVWHFSKRILTLEIEHKHTRQEIADLKSKLDRKAA